jgi:hypothetical protein
MNHHFNVIKHCVSPLFKEPGKWLFCALQQGWHAVGLGFNRTATAKAKERFGVDLVQGNLYELDKDFHLSSFNLISFFHVFEHILNQTSCAVYIGQVYIAQFLRTGGRTTVAVPNICSDNFLRQKEKWSYIHISLHVSYFACRSLDEVFLRRVKPTNGHFETMLQETFPGEGMKQEEAIRIWCLEE